jgi:hypothetical protein
MAAEDTTRPVPATTGRGTAVFGYLPAALAGGAVALYVLGIVASVGALRAADLDSGDVLVRVPLEVHVRNGVGALTDPVLWVVLLLLGLSLVYFAADSFNLGIDAPPSKPPRLLAVAITILLSPVLFVEAWPEALLALSCGLLLFSPSMLFKLHDRVSKGTLLRLFGGLALLTILSVGAAESYFRSDPPPTATVRLAGEASTFKAPLIATDGALVYLGPSESAKDAPSGSYQAIPSSRIVRMTFSRNERKKDEPSIASLLWPW